jgi:hypothetical protein
MAPALRTPGPKSRRNVIAMTYIKKTGPTVNILEWRDCRRNTLVGFCKIGIPAWGLHVDGVAIHRRAGEDRRWAQLPSRPMVENGGLVKDENGKPKYFPIFSFDTKEDEWALMDAILSAYGEYSDA